MAIRKGRSQAASTKAVGGYYKYPKGLKAPGKGYARSYQAQHYMRTGSFGKPSDAKKYQSHYKKGVGGLVASTGGLGIAYVGLKHSSGKLAAAGLATSAAGTTHSIIHQAKAERHLNRASGQSRSAFYGFHPNNRNAKTGVKTSSPQPVKTRGRAARKGF